MTDLTRFPNAVEAIWSSGFPTVATSGAAFIDDPQWGPWNGALAVGCLVGERLLIFPVSGGAVQGTPLIPSELNNSVYGRLRSPVMGPDGALYLTTSEGVNDEILRVTPT
jgi:glucose/arabinose dehydrogenase